MPTKMEKIEIEGMHCVGCEDILKQAVAGITGVEKVEASYSAQTVDVVYDNAKTHRADFEQAIIAKGYGIKKVQSSGNFVLGLRHFALFLLLLVVVGGVAFWGKSQMPGVMQHIKPQMSYAVLLGIGFLTGFHCIGMCGGFVVAYTDPARSKARQLLAHLSYAFGKTLSYTLLGAGFGLLGDYRDNSANSRRRGFSRQRLFADLRPENAQCVRVFAAIYLAHAEVRQ